MKKLKTAVSLLLTVLIVGSCLAVPVSASPLTAEEWEKYYDDASSDALKGIIMQPGSNDTQRNFSWYADKNASSCEVLIADNAEMNGAASFKGALGSTYQGDKRARVTVTDLKAETTYYYTCVSDGFKSDVYSFSTGSDEFSAMVTSDIHIGGEKDDTDSVKEISFTFSSAVAQAKEFSRANGREISAILSSGDQASSGFRSEFVGLTSSPEIKSLDFATAVGNHDRAGVDYRFFKSVPNEYSGLVDAYQGNDYWFVKGSVLFLVMNSNNGSGIDHRAFVQKAVKANPDVKWRVALMHHDLWGQTIPSRENENNFLRILWTPIFDEFNIDLVLLGHSHCFSVSNVMYNKESVESITNGSEITNAKGTVYMVSGSLTRSRGNKGDYGKNIGIGIDNSERIVCSVIDFNRSDITVRTYNVEDSSLYATFKLVKTDDNQPVKFSAARSLASRFVNLCGTIYAFFNNFTIIRKLKSKGYDVSIFDIIFNKNGSSFC